MPLLASTQTNTANGVPLYVPSDGEGNAVVAGSLLVENGLIVNQGGGTVLSAGSAGVAVGNTLSVASAVRLSANGNATTPTVGVIIGNSAVNPANANGLVVSGDVFAVGSAFVGNGTTPGSGVLDLGAGAAVLTPDATGGVILSTLTPAATAKALIPQITNGSLFSVPTEPVAVDYGPSPFGSPAGTFVIAGVRFMWGNTNFGATGSGVLTFAPAFGASPCVVMTPQFIGSVVGYATINSVNTLTANYDLTTSGGSAFGTNAYWMAIGAA